MYCTDGLFWVIEDLITTRKVNIVNDNVEDVISYNLMKIRQRISKVMIQSLVKGVLGHFLEEQ
jgi:hypothetical protein